MTRRTARAIALSISALVVLIFSLVGPIDRTPVREQEFYRKMMARLDTITPDVFTATGVLLSGWTKINITPRSSMPMAGYSPRDGFDSVHDSLYARVLKIDNGGMPVVFINVDLLLFPKGLKDRINEKLDSAQASPFLYLSATHTHNGVGGWDNSIGGRIAFGTFQEAWVEKTAGNIVSAIVSITVQPSRLSYWDADASERVENRIDRENGETDGMIRGIRIVRNDSSRAILFTFSAHPTSIEKDSRILSADYPGAVISRLEDKYDFGMFMAGMVGSHRFAWVPETGFEFINMIAPVFAEKIAGAQTDSALSAPDIRAMHVPIEFGPAQPRIGRNWKIRNWITSVLARPLQGEATYVEIGNIIFIGLPCDFSGEIFKREHFAELAASVGKHVIITSFNGDYNGYITWDSYYEESKAEEVNTTNWVGPGYGKYFAEIVETLISPGVRTQSK